MAQPQAQPRNWFFTLLIPASIAFAVTAIALAVVPVLEDRAREAGSPPPASEFRAALRRDGWLWLLIETGLVIVLAMAAMTWDWMQRESGNGKRETETGGRNP